RAAGGDAHSRDRAVHVCGDRQCAAAVDRAPAVSPHLMSVPFCISARPDNWTFITAWIPGATRDLAVHLHEPVQFIEVVGVPSGWHETHGDAEAALEIRLGWQDAETRE